MKDDEILAIWLDFKEGLENGEIANVRELIHYLRLLYKDNEVRKILKYYKLYRGITNE